MILHFGKKKKRKKLSVTSDQHGQSHDTSIDLYSLRNRLIKLAMPFLCLSEIIITALFVEQYCLVSSQNESGFCDDKKWPKTVKQVWRQIDYFPKRDFIFARVKTRQVGTWSPIE